jgi:hypothetical protein
VLVPRWAISLNVLITLSVYLIAIAALFITASMYSIVILLSAVSRKKLAGDGIAR